MSNNKYLYWITFVAINGGLLFGLNMAGISGAVDMIKGEFSLTDTSDTSCVFFIRPESLPLIMLKKSICPQFPKVQKYLPHGNLMN